MFRRRPIRAQMAIFAIAAVLPLLAVIAYGVWESSTEARARAERVAARGAAEHAVVLQEFLRDIERTLAAIAARPLVRALDPAHCDPVLDELSVVIPRLDFVQLSNLGIRNARGEVVCARVAGMPDAKFARSFPPFERGLQANAFQLSNAFQSRVTKRWTMLVSYPVRDDGGHAVGLVYLRIDLRDLQSHLFANLSGGNVVSVFDRNGNYAMRSIDPDRWIGKPVRNLDLVRRIGGGSQVEYHTLTSTDGTRRLYALRPLGATGWMVGSGIPEDEIYAPYRRRLAEGIAVGAGALLFALLLAARIGRGVLQPVHALERAVRRVAGDDRSARAPLEGAPELVTVATEFNRMLDARERDEAGLREARQRLGGILDTAMDAIVTTDESQTIIQFNAAAQAMFGLAPEQALGKPLDILIPERFRGSHRGQVGAFGASGKTRRRMGTSSVLPALHADGHEFPIEASISKVEVGGRSFFTVIHRDITQRVEADRQLRRQADLYAALSQTNHAIVRMHDPDMLYSEICRICVEYGRVAIAYVGLIEGDAVRPVAWAGPAGPFLDGIVMPLDDPQMRGPIATAVTEGRRHVCNDFLADPCTLPWRERAAYLGTRALAAFPFRRGGRIAGALSLHVTEADFFDDRLVALLEEMCADLSFGLDNHDRLIAQAESRRQEAAAYESFRKIFSSAPVAIAISSVSDGQIADVNEAFAALFGYAREELLSHSSLELGAWADPAARERFMTLLRSEHRVRNFRGQLRTRSGELRDGVANAELINFMGAPHTLMIVDDVTEQLLAEKRIRREADFYAAASQTSKALIHKRDPHSLYEEVCRICVEYGHATIAFVGLIRGGRVEPVAWAGPARPYLDGIEIDLGDPARQGPIATAIAQGAPYVCNDILADPKTLSWRGAAAKIATSATAAFPIRRGGGIVGVLSLHVQEAGFFDARLVELLDNMAADIAFGLDNFDRALAQAESERSQRAALESFSKVFHSAPMAMSIATLDEGRLEDVNEAYCGFFGYPEEALIGRTAGELGLWDEPDNRDTFAAAMRAEGGVRDYEQRFRTRSGELRTAIVNAELIDMAGGERLLFILNDITQRKQAEELLRDVNVILERRVAERTAELEAANRELEAYGRTIAHDLRAPVRAISGFGEALRKSLAGTLDATGEKYLHRVEANAARMDTMLTDMLEFARSGRAPLEKTAVDMRAMASAVAEELSASAPAPVRISIEDLPPAHGDASLLRQVWVNLISNAFKYSSKTENPCVEIGATPATGTIGYYVRDNGCGYDPEFAGKLFQPFERLHSQSEFEGSGIGLAIVQRIVERHGGTVSAHSEPGRGATFGFNLPA